MKQLLKKLGPLDWELVFMFLALLGMLTAIFTGIHFASRLTSTLLHSSLTV